MGELNVFRSEFDTARGGGGGGGGGDWGNNKCPISTAHPSHLASY